MLEVYNKNDFFDDILDYKKYIEEQYDFMGCDEKEIHINSIKLSLKAFKIALKNKTLKLQYKDIFNSLKNNKYIFKGNNWLLESDLEYYINDDILYYYIKIDSLLKDKNTKSNAYENAKDIKTTLEILALSSIMKKDGINYKIFFTSVLKDDTSYRLYLKCKNNIEEIFCKDVYVNDELFHMVHFSLKEDYLQKLIYKYNIKKFPINIKKLVKEKHS